MSQPQRPGAEDAPKPSEPASGRTPVEAATTVKPVGNPTVDRAFAGAIEAKVDLAPVNLGVAAASPEVATAAQPANWLPAVSLLGGAALALLGGLFLHQNDDANGALSAVKRDVETSAAQTDARLKAVEGRAQGALDAQAKTIVALEKRLKEAEARLAGPVAAIAAPAGQASAVDGRLEALEQLTTKSIGQLGALGERVGKIENDLAAPKTNLQATTSKMETPMASSLAAQLAIATSLLGALERGAPYQAEVAALENLGVDPAKLAPLKTGVPSNASLAAEFKTLAPAMAAPPAAAAPASPSLLDQLSASVTSLVDVRKDGEPGRDEIAGQVAGLSTLIGKGDLAGASSAWAKLAPSAQAVSKVWIAGVNTRASALGAARELINEAISGLAVKK